MGRGRKEERLKKREGGRVGRVEVIVEVRVGESKMGKRRRRGKEGKRGGKRGERGESWLAGLRRRDKGEREKS